MTSGCGCRLRARPARSAIRRAWSARAEQVARAILEYYKLGIGSVLIRGFDPFNDTVEFGRELIPRIKAGADEIDRLQAAG